LHINKSISVFLLIGLAFGVSCNNNTEDENQKISNAILAKGGFSGPVIFNCPEGKHIFTFEGTVAPGEEPKPLNKGGYDGTFRVTLVVWINGKEYPNIVKVVEKNTGGYKPEKFQIDFPFACNNDETIEIKLQSKGAELNINTNAITSHSYAIKLNCVVKMDDTNAILQK